MRDGLRPRARMQVDTPAVFRSSDAAFYFRYSNTQGIADGSFAFGDTDHLPGAGKWIN